MQQVAREHAFSLGSFYSFLSDYTLPSAAFLSNLSVPLAFLGRTWQLLCLQELLHVLLRGSWFLWGLTWNEQFPQMAGYRSRGSWGLWHIAQASPASNCLQVQDLTESVGTLCMLAGTQPRSWENPVGSLTRPVRCEQYPQDCLAKVYLLDAFLSARHCC